MKVAISLIIVFLLLGIVAFFVIPFFLQNISLPGFSGASGVAGIFKSTDGGDSWLAKNSIDSSKYTISSAGISDIAFDPFDNNIIYIGTESSGIFRSVNNGEGWKKITDGNKTLGSNAKINKIAISSKDSSHILVAAFQNDSGAIFKTEDAGQSWEQVYIVPITKQDVRSIVIDPINSNILYAGTTAGGFLASSDGGDSWRVLKWFSNPIDKIIINPSLTSEIFIIMKNKGISRTNDGGVNWTDITSTFSNYPSAIKTENLVIDPTRTNVLYMTSAYGLLRSEDSGNSWKPIKILVPTQSLPVQDIAVNRYNGRNLFMSAGSKIYISDDGGENWSVKSLNTGKIAKIIKIDPKNPKVIFLGIHK